MNIETSQPMRQGLFAVIGWAHFPSRRRDIFQVLRTTRDDELQILMHRVGGLSGHLAWAEFGRRNYGQHFAVEPGRPPYAVPSKEGPNN